MRRKGLLWACLICCMTFGGCGDGDDPFEEFLGFFLNINNVWSVEGDPNSFYTIRSQSQRARTAKFEGDEDRNGTISPLSGSYTDFDITFVVDRATGKRTFSGKFITENRIEVSAGSERVVLIR